MSPRLRDRLSGIAPWSGLIAAGAGWGLHQQLVTDALHFDCSATADGRGIALGLVALAIVVGGAFVSWRALPAADAASAEDSMRRFIAHLSLMAAVLATLGLGFHILAGALLPGCPPG
jgi:hypothetical protein